MALKTLLTHHTTKSAFLLAVAGIVLSLGNVTTGFSQTVGNYDRESGREMLKMIRLDLQKHYYDLTFRGIDIDARFKLTYRYQLAIEQRSPYVTGVTS